MQLMCLDININVLSADILFQKQTW